MRVLTGLFLTASLALSFEALGESAEVKESLKAKMIAAGNGHEVEYTDVEAELAQHIFSSIEHGSFKDNILCSRHYEGQLGELMVEDDVEFKVTASYVIEATIGYTTYEAAAEALYPADGVFPEEVSLTKIQALDCSKRLQPVLLGLKELGAYDAMVQQFSEQVSQ